MKNLNYSIVMPIYERSEIIRRCFLSIKRQTILPEEIIFIDNNKYIKRYLVKKPIDIKRPKRIKSEIFS